MKNIKFIIRIIIKIVNDRYSNIKPILKFIMIKSCAIKFDSNFKIIVTLN